MHRFLIFVVCLIGLSSCDNYPADPDNTLTHIQDTKVIRVGVIEHAPWAYRSGEEADGTEAELIKGYANTLSARVAWQFLPEATAFDMLKKGQIDVVIGGLTMASPRSKEAGFTRPYLKTGSKKNEQHVVAAPRGENAFISDLETFMKRQQASDAGERT